MLAPSSFQIPSAFAPRTRNTYSPGGTFVYVATFDVPASIQSE